MIPRPSPALSPIASLGATLLAFGLFACSGSSRPSTPGIGPEAEANQVQEMEGMLATELDKHLRQVASAQLDFAPDGPISDEELRDYHVVIAATLDGQDLEEMAFTLWADRAPFTVRNFLRLASSGFYDGLTFHRVIRDFMIQGGCVQGNGLGKSPLGSIPGEFSNAADRDHLYGVLSMARAYGQPNSAGSQFFLINHEGHSSDSLNGEYASFGRLTKGVASLEALSNTPVVQDPTSGKPTKPTKRLAMRYVRVIKGPAPEGETIERPFEASSVDLNGEPERVHVQMLLVGFEGSRTRATRTKQEAQELAKTLLGRLEEGADFESLAAEFSDDPQHVSLAGQSGIYGWRLLNTGIWDRESEKQIASMNRDGQSRARSLQAEQAAGTLGMEEFRQAVQELQKEIQGKLLSSIWVNRNQLPRPYSAASRAFQMEVGESVLVEHDNSSNPLGWMLLRRVQ